MINWDNIKLEGDDAKAALELLKKNEIFTSYVTDSVTNREAAARQSAEAEAKTHKAKVDEFRNTNIELSKKLEGFDVEDYERLKKIGSNDEQSKEKLAALELDYKSQLEGKDKTISELNEKNNKLGQDNVDNEFRFDMHRAIAKYNVDNKDIPVNEQAQTVLIEKAMASRKVVDGKTVMLKADGTELTTDKGLGTQGDWISEVARNEFSFCFSEAGGSGATGNKSGGAGSKQMTRGEFDAISDPVQKSEIAKTHSIVD